MVTQTCTKTIDEAQIRQRIKDWTEAVRAKDIDRLMSNYTTDIVLFDIQPPSEYQGIDAYRQVWEQCFACLQEIWQIRSSIPRKRTTQLPISPRRALCN